MGCFVIELLPNLFCFRLTVPSLVWHCYHCKTLTTQQGLAEISHRLPITDRYESNVPIRKG